MTCETCTATRICAGHNRVYDPLCLWCGARYIKQLGQFGGTFTNAEIAQRRRDVLRDWMAFGHDETEMRELAKGPMPVEPVVGRIKADKGVTACA